LQQPKQKKTESKSKDAPRKMHRIWSNKKIVYWKVTWFLPMKKGCLGGIPKLWRLYLLDISWGKMGIPKLELSSILHFISSLSIPYNWKLPSYKTSHNSIGNVSISIIINQPFWFSFKLKKTTYKAYTTIATSSKVLWSKELKKKVIERQTQIVAEICQNRTSDKGQFFRGPSVTQIEKCKTNESLDITWAICTRNLRSKRYSKNFHECLWCSTEICFRTATSPNLTSLKLEVLLGTTTK
jgi:hypothetical protein